MEGFTIVDGVVLLILAVSALLAFSRGFVREVLSIVGWIIAAVVAFYFAPQAEPLLREVPVLSDLIGNSCELSMIIAFFAVFAVALVVVSIFTPLFSGIIQNSALGPLDQGLGFLFGVARGVLLVAIALIVYERVVAGGDGFAPIEDSRTKVVMADAQKALEAQIPTDMPVWLTERFAQLTGNCGNGQTGSQPTEGTGENTGTNG
jgi:membrane protein required for colicin V production